MWQFLVDLEQHNIEALMCANGSDFVSPKLLVSGVLKSPDICS